MGGLHNRGGGVIGFWGGGLVGWWNKNGVSWVVTLAIGCLATKKSSSLGDVRQTRRHISDISTL